jgi:S-adenosylmethionine synthetase
MDLLIRAMGPLPGDQPVEVVECKGRGHPDTVCDGIAEQVSRSLCQYYQEHFGQILHHNVDKVLLVGGASCARFGGGEVTEPIEIYLAGRATHELRGERIPVAELAVEACRTWLRQNLRYLDVDRHVRIVSRIRPGSSDLTGLFARERTRPLANDTSCGVGFAPFSELEKAVLCVERALRKSEVKQQQPALGEDIKIMGVRLHDQITLTVGCAFVARHVENLAAYRVAKQAVQELVLKSAREASALPTSAVVNAGDDLERGQIFLTVVGTSAESGDDGEVGRGNRACGLITPYRPMTLEAAAGKNPVNHVGKLYNVVAGRIASALAASAPEVRGVSCLLVSQIGRAVDDPHVVDLGFAGGDRDQAFHARAKSVVCDQLQRLPELRQLLLDGQVSVY